MALKRDIARVVGLRLGNGMKKEIKELVTRIMDFGCFTVNV